MAKVCLVVLVGLPGAGKTTFCKELLQRDLSFSIIHVCYDSFVNIDFKMHQSFKLQRQSVLNSVRELISYFNGTNLVLEINKFAESSRILGGANKLVVLIDDNNFYQSMRYDYYKLAKELKTVFSEVYFETPLHLAIERNSQRQERIPIEVVIQMNNCLEPPSENHKWEAKVFTIRSGECDYYKFLIFLNECFESLIQENHKLPTAVVEQSQLHKVDLLLRKRVGAVIKELSHFEKDIRAIAADLNIKRRQILDDIRQGLIVLEPTDHDYLINLI